MSSVTPNIGLILPDGSENVSRQVINENYTKIDTAFANVGNSTMREVPFNIPTSAWTLSDGVYTAEFTTVYVTASSKEIGTYTSSLRQYAKADIDMTKKSGGGGMVFTTTTAPTGTISGSLYIWDNDDGKVPIVVEGTVIPISNGGTGANDISTAKSNLGITAVENQTSANTQAIATLNDFLNKKIGTITVPSDVTATMLDCFRTGNVAMVNIIVFKTSWSEGDLIATIPEGFRPYSHNVYATIRCYNNISNNDIASINASNGQMTIWNKGTQPTGNLYITATYICN